MSDNREHKEGSPVVPHANTRRGRDRRLVDTRVRDIAPGIWIDGNGDAHVSIEEIHARYGIPHTPENIAETRGLVAEMMRTCAAGDGLPLELIHRDQPPAREALNS